MDQPSTDDLRQWSRIKFGGTSEVSPHASPLSRRLLQVEGGVGVCAPELPQAPQWVQHLPLVPLGVLVAASCRSSSSFGPWAWWWRWPARVGLIGVGRGIGEGLGKIILVFTLG